MSSILSSISVVINAVVQRIEDTAEQMSYSLMVMNETLAEISTVVNNHSRLVMAFGGVITRDNEGVIVPTLFEKHERSRREFFVFAVVALVLSIIYTVLGCYFGFTQDPYYLFLVFAIALGLGCLWHFGIRAAAFRVFKLKPEYKFEPDESKQSRVRLAEITCVVLFALGFICAVIFSIGRFSGDEAGFFADYYLESLVLADIFALAGSGISHAVSDYYAWSRTHTQKFQNAKRRLFKLRAQISKLAALLSSDMKQYNQFDEKMRPPIALPAEVMEVLRNYEEAIDKNPAEPKNQPEITANTANTAQLPEDNNNDETEE